MICARRKFFVKLHFVEKHLHMKRLLSLACTLALCASLVSGCEWFNVPDQDTTIPEGVLFFTNANLVFYFVDGEGNDLVDILDQETYPVVYPDKVSGNFLRDAVANPEAATVGSKVYKVYTSGHNWLFEDDEEKLTAFGTHMWGKTVELSYTEYVYLQGAMDSICVDYRYVTDSSDARVVGGGWAVDVMSVRYNGVEIFSGNENGKVFIEKPSRDETVVKVSRR